MKVLYCPQCLNEIQEEQSRCPVCGLKKPEDGWSVDERVGQVIFETVKIVKRIGGGRTGTVYLAEDIDTGEKIAIKILHPSLSDDADLIKRFQVEALVSKSLSSKHIVKTYDFGRLEDGAYYLTMEYVAGVPLSKIFEKYKRLSVKNSVLIMRQIFLALKAAHSANIVHRDLKPDNIFVVRLKNNGILVKILDFGFAKITTGNTFFKNPTITKSKLILGTPNYMSPEQIRGDENIDHRSDLYSAGVIFYRLVTGKLPFEANSVSAVLKMHLEKTPLPPSEVVESGKYFPVILDDIILKLLEKIPEKRFKNADEVLGVLNTHFPPSREEIEALKSTPGEEVAYHHDYIKEIGRYVEDSDEIEFLAKNFKNRYFYYFLVAGIVFLIILLFLIKFI